AQDYERAARNSFERGRDTSLRRFSVGKPGAWMKRLDLSDHGVFELDAAIESTLELRRYRDRHSRNHDIVLRAYGTLLSDVAALRRDRRDVVPAQRSAPRRASSSGDLSHFDLVIDASAAAPCPNVQPSKSIDPKQTPLLL